MSNSTGWALIKKYKWWYIIGLLVVIIISEYIKPASTNQPSITPPQTNEDEAKQLHKTIIERQFSAWDGSHIQLKKLVKKQLNDPDSFEHIKTNYFDNQDSITVLMYFRASNSFNAKVKGFARAKYDLKGQLIELERFE